MPSEPASANDLYQVIVRFTLEGQHCENVLNFRVVTAMDDFELRVILVLIQCFVAFLAQIPSSMEFTEVAWKKTSPVLGVENITVFPAGSQGGALIDALPSFNSAVVSIRTALGGRSHRGRIYLAGIPESAALGSILDKDGPYWTALLAFITCLTNNFITVGDPPGTNKAVLGVYSRKLGGAAFPFNNTGFTPAKTLVPHVELGTTRSRKIGKGG